MEMAITKVRHSEGYGVYVRAVAGPDNKSLDKATQARVTELLRDFIEKAGGQAPAAEAIGISQGYLSDILSGKRGAGQKLIRGLGKHRPDIAQILITGVVSVPSVQGTRYPNRELAIHQLVEYGAGTETEVREAADAFGVALKSDSDLPVLKWVREIEDVLHDLRRGRRPKGMPVTELGDEGVGANFNNVIKRKKRELL